MVKYITMISLLAFLMINENVPNSFAQSGAAATDTTAGFAETFIVFIGLCIVFVAFKAMYGHYIDKRNPKKPAIEKMQENIYSSFEIKSDSTKTTNTLRGVIFSVLGAIIGTGVGYATLPYKQGTMFWTQSQANEAVQQAGVHMLISIAVGFGVGLLLHNLLPATKR